MSRAFFDAGLVVLAMAQLLATIQLAAAVREPFQPAWRGLFEAVQLGLTGLVCWVAAVLVTGSGDGASVATGVTIGAAILLRVTMRRLTAMGALDLVLPPLALLVGLPWMLNFLVDGGAPDWLITVGAVLGLASVVPLSFAVIERLAREAVITHREWRSPIVPLAPMAGNYAPKVSIHLPAYAEPPEIVIAVIDRLAALDYPDFEVLVCDNNTPDEALWRPVERHCAALNRRLGQERFRFFHVAPLEGAKAGALNVCLDRTAPEAELIAVIDADYLAEPDFLSRLVGFFEDPWIGYVQTPHDYRAHDDSTYLTACYWEYMPSNKVGMPGVGEYGAAFTIGTMCVLRRTALEQAGRWAEWCLTEDSEVSVRLRAMGQEGVYLSETFGRGLIPETFDDYRKQRFRWTAGPVQQLCRHWRLFVPRIFGGSDALSGWSKLLEVQRGAAPILQAGGLILGTIAALAGLLAMSSGAIAPVALPRAAWLAVGLGAAAAALRIWHNYHLAGCRSLRQMLLGELARLSLSYIQMVAGIAGLSRKPLAWRRTPKFAVERAGLARTLAPVMPETAIGLALIAATVALGLLDQRGSDLAVLANIGLLVTGARFLCAPAMALLGERHAAAGWSADLSDRREDPLAARV